ncbi:MAG TPA: DUF559 domain-containing protein [Xanthobacteraceae bacterium]|nr:DUF559 domain-containing protein [Xanthobacteraceae bacterium]
MPVVGDPRPRSVEFTASELVVTLEDGRKIATPLDWYPRLKGASPPQRANFELMPMGIHWPELDEDLGIAGMLKGRRGRAARATSPRLRGEVDARSASGEGVDPHARPNEIKTERARRLRANSTKAELRLWRRLRSLTLRGQKFVRQEPIGPYIVDFVCREQRLVIEVDGSQHATDKRDAVRDRWLAEHRYRLLRFWNNDVMGNMDGVLEMIAAALPSDGAE